MRKLHGLLAASDSEAMAFCKMELYRLGYTVMSDAHPKNGYIFATPGTLKVTPVLLMAHIDTRRITDDVVLKQYGDTLYNDSSDKAGCLGADDRAGVYVILEMIERMEDKPYVLFTLGEETGYHGAHTFTEAVHPELSGTPESFYKDKFIWEPYVDNIFAVIQFDRKGMNEATFYGRSFQDTKLKTKLDLLGYFIMSNGTSDSQTVCEALLRAGVNMSCGFMHAHTADELLIIPAVKFAIDNGLRLCRMIYEKHELPPRPVYTYTPKQVYPPAPRTPKLTPSYEIKRDVACDVCEKKRVCVYVPAAQANVCLHCVNRAGGIDKITFSSLHGMILNLDDERAKSRRENRAKTGKPNLVCPVCFDEGGILPLKHDVGYCQKDKTYFTNGKDKSYLWSDRSKVVYARDHDDKNMVYEVDSMRTEVPATTCFICGRVHAKKELAYYYDANDHLSLIVCHACDLISPRR